MPASYGPRSAIIAARLRVALLVLGAVLLVLGTADLLGDVTAAPWLFAVAVLVMGVGYALYLRVGTVVGPPVRLRPPVTGRWVPINSPGTKVPSHGLHAYGQTYAVDLVHVPTGRWELELGWAPLTRAARDFPSYGQPVLAPADATVVRVRHWMRDHRSRTSWPALAFMFLEGMLRELTGPGRVFGNHVVLRLDEGTYVVLAHLRRRSVTVTPGQRVTAGEQLAECGNSGNTSEPHVHVQVMDRPQTWLAAGLPMAFDGIELEDGDRTTDVPADGQHFTHVGSGSWPRTLAP